MRLSAAVTSIYLSIKRVQKDVRMICELCALGNDNRVRVCGAFEVWAGGAGVCMAGGECGGVCGGGGSDGVEGEVGIDKIMLKLLNRCSGSVTAARSQDTDPVIDHRSGVFGVFS